MTEKSAKPHPPFILRYDAAMTPFILRFLGGKRAVEQPFSCIVGAGRGVNGVKGVRVKGVKVFSTTPMTLVFYDDNKHFR